MDSSFISSPSFPTSISLEEEEEEEVIFIRSISKQQLPTATSFSPPVSLLALVWWW
jgi:DNA-directed RNA polymerase subunit H (RpoH/RPB5)